MLFGCKLAYFVEQAQTPSRGGRDFHEEESVSPRNGSRDERGLCACSELSYTIDNAEDVPGSAAAGSGGTAEPDTKSEQRATAKLGTAAFDNESGSGPDTTQFNDTQHEL